MPETRERITQLLEQAGGGDRRAAEELLPLVYGELRRLARARLAKERPGQTLQPTGLVHEAYLRLVGGGDPGWDNTGHFFAAAGEAMRRILVERARREASRKRGGGWQRVTLDEGSGGGQPGPGYDVVALDQALCRLEELDPGMARVVTLRYFAGLSVEEAAVALGQSPRTVNRLWTGARAWLHRELSR